MKHTLDLAPKAIAVLSFAILSLTVIHEQGYFWVVGSNFLTVASAYDYLSNAILWLPQSVLSIFASVVLTGIAAFTFRSLRESEDQTERDLGFRVRAERLKKHHRAGLWAVAGFLIVSVSIAVVTYFFISPQLVSPFGLSLGLGYMSMFLLLALSFEKYAAALPRQLWASVLILPPFLIAIFYLGADEAHRDIANISDVYILAFEGEHSADLVSSSMLVQVLRSFDKGVLVRDPVHERIDFVRWDALRSLERPSYGTVEMSRGLPALPKDLQFAGTERTMKGAVGGVLGARVRPGGVLLNDDGR